MYAPAVRIRCRRVIVFVDGLLLFKGLDQHILDLQVAATATTDPRIALKAEAKLVKIG